VRHEYRAIYTLLFGIRIKENPEIRELIENENIGLFQEEYNELRQEAKDTIAGIQEENRRYCNKKRKASNKYNIYTIK